jgi:hypothetical protein
MALFGCGSGERSSPAVFCSPARRPSRRRRTSGRRNSKKGGKHSRNASISRPSRIFGFRASRSSIGLHRSSRAWFAWLSRSRRPHARRMNEKALSSVSSRSKGSSTSTASSPSSRKFGRRSALSCSVRFRRKQFRRFRCCAIPWQDADSRRRWPARPDPQRRRCAWLSR